MKLQKLSNKKLMLSALDYIEKCTGFHINEKHLGSSYFVFEGERNSICNFHIKELPGFVFSLWNTCRFDTIDYFIKNNITPWSDSLNVPIKSELIFFCQYSKFIDKFKPSTSNLVCGLYRTTYETDGKSVEEWVMDDVIDILNYLHKHRIKGIYYSSFYGNRIWHEESSIKILYTVCKELLYNYIYNKRREHRFKRIKNKLIRFAKRLKCYEYYIIDEPNCLPRYTLVLRLVEDNNIDNINKDLAKLTIFESKYYDDITIRDMYVYSTKMTTEDKVLDKKYRKQFDSIFKSVKNGDFGYIIKTNIK